MFPDEKLVSDVEFEMDEISKLLESYQLPLEKVKMNQPDLIEMTALAAVVHSFYNGIENILQLIAKRVDQNVPTGYQWHRDLLEQMSAPNDKRKEVISKELKSKLTGYLGFRHFFRHAYSFHLGWDEMKDLVFGLNDTWNDLQRELKHYLNLS